MPSLSFLLLLSPLATIASSPLTTVQDYVLANYKDVLKPPSNNLQYPYLVPAGPYEQCWDWDSVFMGLALLPLNSSSYLAGSMKNFFAATNLTSGDVTICVDPNSPTPSCSSDPTDNPASGSHAKPLLIQGALLAARSSNDYDQFKPFQLQMSLLLSYWTTQRQTATGLYTWHDQMESGADDLPTSPCPSPRSDCWSEASDGNSLAAPDLMTFLIREHRAYASFLDAWNDTSGAAAEHRATALEIADALTSQLFIDNTFLSYNATENTVIDNAVYTLAFPLFAGPDILTSAQADAVVARIFASDMMSEFGVRSTSSNDPVYNNEPTLTPYSNWQGPVWINANAIIVYGLLDYGYYDEALDLANRTINVLYNDIVATKTWHEAYDSSDGGSGAGLAAEGFLSWNTLGYRLLDDVRAKKNPFQIY